MLSKLRRRTANNPASTRFSHLLTSNDPPSDVEETLVRSMIQAMRGEIAALKLGTGYCWRLLRWFTIVEDREAAIAKRIVIHESVMSPLRRLPTELLQLILQKTYWDPTTTLMLPWSFSQVCRLWRTIVHATPIFWSHVALDFNSPMNFPSQEAKLKLILQRSAHADLWISIQGLMDGGDQHLSLLSILLAHSERWLSLNLTMNVKTVGALQGVQGHLSRLSALHLKSGNFSGVLNLFSIAPRLEDVVVIDYAYTCNPPQYILKPAGPREPRITLPRLKVLVVRFESSLTGGDNRADLFFGWLILPSIRKILVHDWAYGAASAISSMISQSLPCHLDTLSIEVTTFPRSGDLTDLLLLTPQLKYLEIPLPPLPDLSNIFATPGIPVLVPRLESLHILILSPYPASEPSPGPAALIAISELLSNVEVFRLRILQVKFADYISELDINVLAQINSWTNNLVEERPCQMALDVKRWRRLDLLFSVIEGYDIPTSGYLHDLHLYQWLHTELTVLTYVPQGSGFRESSNAVDLIYNSPAMSEFYRRRRY
ncbi:hypothetical protein M413DRAFT_430101 [Hebeloma cylindrosporum]|uniref:Uncharacterized protein n=1 Tax=Hebeloma cylindrosporum TaxID=76867 RepID=A0A0C2Y6L3_HEBCY|nr:hypothetical protein M413DRAFT_430101 [Hebeloma cylindrosporum h7]